MVKITVVQHQRSLLRRSIQTQLVTKQRRYLCFGLPTGQRITVENVPFSLVGKSTILTDQSRRVRVLKPWYIGWGLRILALLQSDVTRSLVPSVSQPDIDTATATILVPKKNTESKIGSGVFTLLWKL